MVLAAPVLFQRSASRTLLSNPGGLHQRQVSGARWLLNTSVPIQNAIDAPVIVASVVSE